MLSTTHSKPQSNILIPSSQSQRSWDWESIGQLIYLFFNLDKKTLLMGHPSYKQHSNGKTSVLIPLFFSSSAVFFEVEETFGSLRSIFSHFLAKHGQLEQDLEVRFIKLQYPYLNSSILAQYTALNTEKYPFARIHRTMFKKRIFFGNSRGASTTSQVDEQQVSHSREHAQSDSQTLFGNMIGLDDLRSSVNVVETGNVQGNLMPSLPYLLKGLKLELAGRLTTQRSVPRKTVFNKHIGVTVSCAEAPGLRSAKQVKLNYNFNQYASKNKLGAYTIKAWLS